MWIFFFLDCPAPPLHIPTDYLLTDLVCAMTFDRKIHFPIKYLCALSQRFPPKLAKHCTFHCKMSTLEDFFDFLGRVGWSMVERCRAGQVSKFSRKASGPAGNLSLMRTLWFAKAWAKVLELGREWRYGLAGGTMRIGVEFGLG